MLYGHTDIFVGQINLILHHFDNFLDLSKVNELFDFLNVVGESNTLLNKLHPLLHTFAVSGSSRRTLFFCLVNFKA
jgi:hypothetical protein